MQSVVKKEDPSEIRASHPQYSLLDMRRTEDLLWFVKIPSYIEDDIKQIKNPMQIGEIVIEQYPDGTKKATMVIDNKIIKSVPPEMLPSKYMLRFDEQPNESQYAFTHDRTTGIVRMLGHINTNANVTPMPNELSKSAEIRKYKEKIAKSKVVKKKVENELPVMISTRKESNKKPPNKRENKEKRIRMSEDAMITELIKAYREKESWSLSDLSEQLNQNPDHIRSVISNVASYNNQTKTWDIKPDIMIQK